METKRQNTKRFKKNKSKRRSQREKWNRIERRRGYRKQNNSSNNDSKQLKSDNDGGKMAVRFGAVEPALIISNVLFAYYTAKQHTHTH